VWLYSGIYLYEKNKPWVAEKIKTTSGKHVSGLGWYLKVAMVLSTKISEEVTVITGVYTSKKQVKQWAAVAVQVKCVCSKPYGKLKVSWELGPSFFKSSNPFCLATLLCLFFPSPLIFFFLKSAIEQGSSELSSNSFPLRSPGNAVSN